MPKFHRLKRGPDMIFWFNVTPSFLSALPDSVAAEMGKEYNIIAGKNPDAGQPSAPVTCKYFNVCQVPLERELKVNVYPNPATELLNIDFVLPAGVSGSILLTDLSGRIIKQDHETYSGEAPGHASIRTADIKPGIYILILKLNNGAMVNTRVIVGKE